MVKKKTRTISRQPPTKHQHQQPTSLFLTTTTTSREASRFEIFNVLLTLLKNHLSECVCFDNFLTSHQSPNH